jgi:hypothetical protein
VNFAKEIFWMIEFADSNGNLSADFEVVFCIPLDRIGWESGLDHGESLVAKGGEQFCGVIDSDIDESGINGNIEAPGQIQVVRAIDVVSLGAGIGDVDGGGDQKDGKQDKEVEQHLGGVECQD